MKIGQLAARLAGGLYRPLDPDTLRDAVRDALPAVAMGELEPIKNLPGMVRAAVNTLDKVWRAGVDLSAGKHPRLQALRALEEDVLRRLPPSMKRPTELVELACNRIVYAKAALRALSARGGFRESDTVFELVPVGKHHQRDQRLTRFGSLRNQS
jgi:hypothetical protein